MIQLLKIFSVRNIVILVFTLTGAIGLYYTTHMNATIPVKCVVIARHHGEKFSTIKNQTYSEGMKYYFTVKSDSFGYGTVVVNEDAYYKYDVKSIVYFSMTEMEILERFHKRVEILPWYYEQPVYALLFALGVAIIIFSAIMI